MKFMMTRLYCPNCGRKPIVVEDDIDNEDYYTGPIYVCVLCSYHFTKPFGEILSNTSSKYCNDLVSGAMFFYHKNKENMK